MNAERTLRDDFDLATTLGLRLRYPPSWRSTKHYQAPYVRTVNDTLVAVVDPHNEAFYFWAMTRRELKQPPSLLHIAAHENTRRSPVELSLFVEEGKTLAEATPEEVFRYAHALGPGSCIEPAARYGIIAPVFLWVNPHDPVQDATYRYTEFASGFNRFFDTERIRESERSRQPRQIWDIDLTAFTCLHNRYCRNTQEDIDQKIAEVKKWLGLLERPACVTVSQSRTPFKYTPAKLLGYTREKTFDMLEQVLKVKEDI